MAPVDDATTADVAEGVPLAAGCVKLLAAAAAIRAAASVGSTRRRDTLRRLPGSGRAALVARAASDEDDALAEAKAAAESAKLELEAARLRAEAEELERAGAQFKRESRARRLLAGAETLPGLPVAELPARLLEIEETEITEQEAMKLATTCGYSESDGAVLLKFEDLSSEGFGTALDDMIATKQAAKEKAEREKRQKEMAEAQAERERRQREAAATSTQQTSGPIGAVNDDTSTGTRVLGCLAYLLPLIDAIQFATLIVQILPFLGILLLPVALVSSFVNLIPFGSPIIFIIFVFAAQNRELPYLLRFNLEQAVLLDIAFFLPNLFISILQFAGGFGGYIPIVGAVSFLVLLLIVIYSWITTLGGELPDGVPGVSGLTKQVIDRSGY